MARKFGPASAFLIDVPKVKAFSRKSKKLKPEVLCCPAYQYKKSPMRKGSTKGGYKARERYVATKK